MCTYTHTYIPYIPISLSAFGNKTSYLFYEMMLIKDGSLGNKGGNLMLILISYSFYFQAQEFQKSKNSLLFMLHIFLKIFLCHILSGNIIFF